MMGCRLALTAERGALVFSPQSVRVALGLDPRAAVLVVQVDDLGGGTGPLDDLLLGLASR